MRTPLFLSLMLACGSVFAAPASLLPAAAGDQVPARLAATVKNAGITDIERAPVSFAWALDPAEVVESARPFTAQSREFWSLIDAAELKAGFRIDTTAPGALIRISPADAAKSAVLGIDGLALRHEGRLVEAKDAFVHTANAEALKAAGADFGAGTIAMRLDPRLGDGRFELVAAKAAGRYLVHVFEPDSNIALSLGADRLSLLAGDTLKVRASLEQGDARLGLDEIGGMLSSPAGESFDLRFKRAGDGSYLAEVAVPESVQGGIGLWEVHTFAGAKLGEREINRDARTAIGIGSATARLAGSYEQKAGAGLGFGLPVEIAAPGRYEIRATLFATGADGQLAAVAQSASAAWLEKNGEIELRFGKELIPAGYGAPFELRELMLKDQGRMADLERRAVALRVEGELQRPVPGNGGQMR
jgi:hypothetical protein